jgi:hypothetical protein
MSLPWLARRFVAALVCCSALSAQSLQTVQPAAAAPGALLRLDGAELGGVRSVRFTALGANDELLVREAPIVSADATTLRVVVPAFADAGAAPQSPWGWVTVAGAPPQPLYFLEGTAGRVRVAGAGTQLANGERLAVSFDPLDGPPSGGNAQFRLVLQGAPAGAPALVLAGPLADGPRLRVGDAALGLDLASSFVVAGSCLTGADGTASLSLPVPALSGVTVAVMWAVVKPCGRLAFSDTLVANL